MPADAPGDRSASADRWGFSAPFLFPHPVRSTAVSNVERLLVAFDGTPLAGQALQHALESYPDAEITVLHVIDYVEDSYGARALIGSDALRERAHERSAELLADAESMAGESDRKVSTATRVGRPAREIVAYADANDIDTIVIGSHGRSLVARVLLGSVAETVVRRAPIPVLVVR
jgi:nucleotide-binding universal stress UspA family protein